MYPNLTVFLSVALSVCKPVPLCLSVRLYACLPDFNPNPIRRTNRRTKRRKSRKKRKKQRTETEEKAHSCKQSDCQA